jgi:hypothetical protein
VWHLDGHETLQLLIVRQVNEAEASFAQDLLEPVATDVRGGGCPRNGLAGFPSGFVNGLVQIVHGRLPSSPVPFRQGGL